MWFLHRKVILTKDYFDKRNWNGNKSCCFCDKDTSFFEWPLARPVWRIVHMSFGLPPPKSTTNLFGNWLIGVPKNDLKNIRVGVYAIIWALWNVRNDFVFNKPRVPSFLQGIHLIMHCIRTWSYLQPAEKHHVMDSGCNIMEMVATNLYNQCALATSFLPSLLMCRPDYLFLYFLLVDTCVNPLRSMSCNDG